MNSFVFSFDQIVSNQSVSFTVLRSEQNSECQGVVIEEIHNQAFKILCVTRIRGPSSDFNSVLYQCGGAVQVRSMLKSIMLEKNFDVVIEFSRE